MSHCYFCYGKSRVYKYVCVSPPYLKVCLISPPFSTFPYRFVELVPGSITRMCA